MRQFLVDHIPDPGALIFVLIASAAFYGLFRMLTHVEVPGLVDDPIADDFAPRAPIEPEHDARRRQI